MEFNVIQSEQPIINVNFDEVKTALTEKLGEYEHIVVTEATLPGCKAAQKELASLRNEVDGKRKEIKKSLSEPINKFEDQCKELVAMIERVEKPIKDGIKVFDDLRRDEKRKAALEIIKEETEIAELNEKYTNMCEVKERYLNLTATMKEVRDDVAAQCLALKAQQTAEEDKIAIIQSTIDRENEKIKQKLSIADFNYSITSGRPVADILGEIARRAEKIYAAENPKEEPKEEPKPEVKEEPKADVEKPLFYVKLELTGTYEEMVTFSTFLKERKINHKILEQTEYFGPIKTGDSETL